MEQQAEPVIYEHVKIEFKFNSCDVLKNKYVEVARKEMALLLGLNGRIPTNLSWKDLVPGHDFLEASLQSSVG